MKTNQQDRATSRGLEEDDMATDTTTPPTDTAKPKTRRAARKPKDPNRAPTKRVRSELYALVGALETAKKKRAVLVKRIGAQADLQAKLAEVDKEIADCGERVRALTDGAASEPTKASTE